MREWDVEFQRLERPDAQVLAISGEIDLAVAAKFAQELEKLIEDSNGDTGLVDLSRVSFMDSSGIRELLKAKRDAEALGKALVLLSPSDPCRRVLEISGAGDEFTIVDNAAS
jgi:anti-sigma B factor antagonist